MCSKDKNPEERAHKCAQRLVEYYLQKEGDDPVAIEVPKVREIYRTIVDPQRHGTKAMIMSTNLGGFKKSLAKKDRDAFLKNRNKHVRGAFGALGNDRETGHPSWRKSGRPCGH